MIEQSQLAPPRERAPRLPFPLPEPATIGVCALSGRIDEQVLARGVEYLREMGHHVIIPEETLHAWRYFAGTDDERLAGFHSLVEDFSVDLVIAARGGYGLSRVLHRIEWNRVAESGKLFLGFSDFTAFNMAAYACANLVTFHGPMLASDFGKEPDTFAEQHMWHALGGREHRIDDIACDHGYEARRIDGRLWGGNLSLLAHLAGTAFFPAIDQGILYVEEVDEEPYAIERMFLQLYHAGALGRQSAILLGDFASCKPSAKSRYPYSMDEMIESLRKLLPCPVLTNLPFGHTAKKVTLPFGSPGVLSIREGSYSLRFSEHTQPVLA